MSEHPMFPSKDELQGWENDWLNNNENVDVLLISAYSAGAKAGADAELEACCKWLEEGPYGVSIVVNDLTSQLRTARRPKPLSLKERALKALSEFWPNSSVDIIRQALESIPNN